jgi:hypothetical protein
VTLLRYPGILVALTVGALLLTLTAAAYPLLMSGMSSRLLTNEIEAPLVGPYGAGMTYKSKNISLRERAPGGRDRLYEARARTFAGLVASARFLGPPEESILGPVATLRDPTLPQRVRAGRLFFGERMLDHVEVVRGSQGRGAWIPDLIARGLRLTVGDPVSIKYGDRRPWTTPVAGVYRALSSRPPRAFWRPWETDIYPTSPGGCQVDCPLPPQFILVGRARLLRLASEAEAGRNPVSIAWRAPLRPGVGLTMDDGLVMEDQFLEAHARASDSTSRVGRIMACCPPADYYLGRPSVEFWSDIERMLDVVGQRIASLTGPGQVLRVTGLLVASAVLASAGIFSVSGRRTEVRFLSARGTGPAGVGIKSATESVLPAVAGGLAGLGVAFLVARVVAAGSPVASTAIGTAARTTSLTIGASIAVLGIVAGMTSIRHAGRPPRGLAAVARIPWELVVLAFGLFAWSRLPANLGSTQISLDVRPPSALLLVFPIVLVGGLAGVGARLFRSVWGALRHRGAGRRRSTYLAVHRLAGAPSLPFLLVTAGALCLGIFVQGQALVDSLRLTVDAKAKVFVGSDVQAWIDPDTTVPPELGVPATRAIRVHQAGTVRPGGQPFDLVGVDAATVARAAYWHEGFAEASVNELAALLRRVGGPIPVIIAGAPDVHPATLEMNQRSIRVDVVAHTVAFPGMSSRRPLVVADGRAMSAAFEGGSDPLTGSTASTELWLRGEETSARRALTASGIPVYQITTARQVKDLPRVATIIDTVGVLQVLAVVSAVLVVAALLMYLQARQRSQIVAQGLSIRMGVDPSTHRWSLVLEIGAMLVAAAVLGAALGVVAAALLVGRLDPLPVVPPDPLFVTPLGAMVAVFLAAVAVSWVGAWFTSRQAARVSLGEALRVAE